MKLRRLRGVTLVEMLVTISIVGILAAIAYPSYANYRYKVGRGYGKQCLMDIQRREESFYIRNNTYSDDVADLSLPVEGSGYACKQDGKTLYTIAISAPAGKTLGCCYELTATAAVLQEKDGDLILTYDSSERDPALRLVTIRKKDGAEVPWD